MALDPTSKESVFRSSLKKYLYENIVTPHGTKILYDAGIAVPTDSGVTVSKWVTVNIDNLDFRDVWKEATIRYNCCARQDVGGTEVSTLRDQAMEIFTIPNVIDGFGRMILYDGIGTGVETPVSTAITQVIFESPFDIASDGTRYKFLTVNFRWGGRF